VVSDSITKSVNITGDVTFLPIGNGTDLWIDAIKNGKKKERDKACLVVKDAGCDINETVDFFENLFLERKLD
jgi:hypothetical protein